jgi:flavodoxin
MKSAIVYYSYSGNTRKVAEVLAEALRQKDEVDALELKAQDESSSFFLQARRAFAKVRARIEPINFDLSNYNLVCFGTPVWAFAPAPAMNTYLGRCFGLEGKEVILFSTYGSGLGRERCIKYMQAILKKKGARNFRKFFIQQFKADDKDFVSSVLKQVF